MLLVAPAVAVLVDDNDDVVVVVLVCWRRRSAARAASSLLWALVAAVVVVRGGDREVIAVMGVAKNAALFPAVDVAAAAAGAGAGAAAVVLGWRDKSNASARRWNNVVPMYLVRVVHGTRERVVRREKYTK